MVRPDHQIRCFPDHEAAPFHAALAGTPITVFHQNRDLRYTWLNNPALIDRVAHILGKTDSEIFAPEDAAPLIALKRRVLATGQSVRDEVRIAFDSRVCYYDLILDPLFDEHGSIIGLTGAAVDITHRHEEESQQRFRARLSDVVRAFDDPHEVMHAAAAALGSHLGVSSVAYSEITSDQRALLVENDYHRGVRSVAGRFPLSDLGTFILNRMRAGRTMVVHNVVDHSYLEPAVIDRLHGLHIDAVVAVPLLKDGQWVAALAAHHHRPRGWSQGEVALIEEVAHRTRQAVERARAERALRDSETRYRLLSELTSDYAFSYRVAEDGRHVVEWKSGAFERITGYADDEVPSAEDWHKLVHPEDLPRLQRCVEHLLANQFQTTELRIITKAGQTRWLSLDMQPIWSQAQQRVERVIGAARDITERKNAEAERQRLLERLEDERALIEQVIDQMPVGVIVLEAPSGKYLFTNAQVQTITGRKPRPEHAPVEQVGFVAQRPDGSVYRPEDWPLLRALRHGEVIAAEDLMFRHAEDGHWVTIRASAAPVRDASGQMIASVTTFLDISENKRAEQAAQFLVKAGRILASSLDYQTTLTSVAQLSVPDLADWCKVDIVNEAGEVQCLASAHAEPKKVKLVAALRRGYPGSPEAPRGVRAVIRTGQPECAPDISDDMLAEIARDETHLRLLRQLGMHSYMCVPLTGRERVLGVLTFVSIDSGRRYGEADLGLAEELARRAAMVIEKTLLYREAQRELADRRAAEHQLQALNETLEQRVAERTAEADQRAAQLRDLAAELTQAEQRERRRLAQTLHDHLQQLLVAAKLRLHAVTDQFAGGPAEETLHQIDDLLAQSIDASRSLTMELSPPILHEAGLPAALDWLARWMKDKHQLEVTVESDPAADPASEEVRVFAFHAVRELLFNVVKHGQTSQGRVELAPVNDELLRLVVSDQGAGFDPGRHRAEHAGFGLFSIQQRLRVFGGHVHMHSAPGQGTRIELLIPRRPTT